MRREGFANLTYAGCTGGETVSFEEKDIRTVSEKDSKKRNIVKSNVR